MALRMNWGAGIALVYGVFALGTLSFAWFALGQPVDLVSDDYYQRALDHDRHQAATAHGRALGRERGIELADDGRGVTVTWTSAAARPREGTATFYRASNPAWDRRTPLLPDADGRQHFPLAGLPAGRWMLQLRWTAAGGEYYVERPVTTR